MMIDFVTTFFTADTLMLIPIFIVLLAIAIKEIVDFVDWARRRGRKAYKKEEQTYELKDQIANINRILSERDNMDTEQQNWIDEKFNKVDDEFKKIDDTLNMLIDSDKEVIRSFILDKWAVYVKGQTPIDTHLMDCLESQYLLYKNEGGNSFVEDLMNELREWHKQNSTNPEN